MIRRVFLQIFFATALSAGAVIAYSVGVRAGDITVMHAFSPASMGAAKSGAVYMMIQNKGSEPDRLTGVATPAAAKAGLHTTDHDGDVMKMRMLEAIDVPAGGMAELKRGGMHVMLFGLIDPLKQGDTLELTLTFEKAGEMTVEVPVKEAMAGMSH